MDELAAVQAYSIPALSFMGTSGIMVAGENNHKSGNSEGLLGSIGSMESTTTNSDGSKGAFSLISPNYLSTLHVLSVSAYLFHCLYLSVSSYN